MDDTTTCVRPITEDDKPEGKYNAGTYVVGDEDNKYTVTTVNAEGTDSNNTIFAPADSAKVFVMVPTESKTEGGKPRKNRSAKKGRKSAKKGRKSAIKKRKNANSRRGRK